MKMYNNCFKEPDQKKIKIKAQTFKDSISASASPFWYSASANWSRVNSISFLIFYSENEGSLNANKLQITTDRNDNNI